VASIARKVGEAARRFQPLALVRRRGASPNLVATPAGNFSAVWIDDNMYTARAAIRPIGQSAFGMPVVLSSSSSTGPLVLSAARGHTAATWIPPVQVSDTVTP